MQDHCIQYFLGYIMGQMRYKQLGKNVFSLFIKFGG